jgi:hypothetical protein
LEVEAKERQRMGQAILPDPDSAGNARVKAAELTGASDGYVRDAKRIVEKDASMLNRLRDGEVTIQAQSLSADRDLIAQVGIKYACVTDRRINAPGRKPAHWSRTKAS